MTSYNDSEDNQKYLRQSSLSGEDTSSQSPVIMILSELAADGNVTELEGSIPLDGQQQDLPSSDSGHVLPRVEADGRSKSRKRP